MKRYKDWLVELHPEVLDRGHALLHDQVVTFGTINNARLQEAVREHYAAGQEAMKDFVRWLVRHEGITPRAAKACAAATWNALCLTWSAQDGASHVEELWLSSEYSTATLSGFRGPLRRWARYTHNHVMSATLEKLRYRDRKSMVIEEAKRKYKNAPYTKAELDAILEATEKLRGDPRWPWGWPVVRLMVVGGIRLVELDSVSMASAEQALKGGSLYLWSVDRGSRSLPAEMLQQELEFLLRWPWSWGTITDVILSGRSRDRSSIDRIVRKLAKHVFELAGVEWQSQSWGSRCRWASALRYYELTSNLVGASHLLGTRDAYRAANRLKALGDLQKEREKARSVLDDGRHADGEGDQVEVPHEGGGVGDEALQPEP